MSRVLQTHTSLKLMVWFGLLLLIHLALRFLMESIPPEDPSSLWGQIVLHPYSPLLLGLVLLVIGIGLPLVLELRRQERHQNTHREPRLRRPSTESMGLIERSSERYHQQGELEAVARAKLVLLTPSGGEAQRHCSTCGRSFSIALDKCPFDGTPLDGHPLKQTSNQAARSGSVICPACERSFAPQVSFCPFDGEELLPDSEDPEADELVVGQCPSCDRLFNPELVRCPHDGASLLVRREQFHDTSIEDSHVCAQCGLQQSARDQCSQCQGELKMIHGYAIPSPQAPERSVDLPRMCPECHSCYPAAHSFCSADGSELLTIN